MSEARLSLVLLAHVIIRHDFFMGIEAAFSFPVSLFNLAICLVPLGLSAFINLPLLLPDLFPAVSPGNVTIYEQKFGEYFG